LVGLRAFEKTSLGAIDKVLYGKHEENMKRQPEVLVKGRLLP